jgi:hypothetical protein
MAGKRVRCPSCQKVVSVPSGGEGEGEDDAREDDGGGRRSRGSTKKKSSTMLYVGIGAGVLLLSCCCLGAIVAGFFMFMGSPNDKVLAANFPVEEKGAWGPFDSRVPVNEPRVFVGKARYRAFKVALKANTTYMIDLLQNGGDSDPYLLLQDSTGNTLATDDDSGTGLNAKIIYTVPTTGEYRIVAATIRGLGDFTLRISETKLTKVLGPGDIGKNPGIGNKGKGSKSILDQRGTWTQQDPIHPERQSRYKTYTVNLQAGKFYTIDLASTNDMQDPFLYLTDSTGKVLAFDDDSGGGLAGLDARIVFVPTQTGPYRIIATSLNNCLGNFTLTVREDVK